MTESKIYLGPLIQITDHLKESEARSYFDECRKCKNKTRDEFCSKCGNRMEPVLIKSMVSEKIEEMLLIIGENLLDITSMLRHNSPKGQYVLVSNLTTDDFNYENSVNSVNSVNEVTGKLIEQSTMKFNKKFEGMIRDLTSLFGEENIEVIFALTEWFW